MAASRNKEHHLCTLVAEHTPFRKCHGRWHGTHPDTAPCNLIFGWSEVKTLLSFSRSTRYAYASHVSRFKTHLEFFELYQIACGHQTSQVKTFITFFPLSPTACGHQTSRFKTLVEFVGLHQVRLCISGVASQNVYDVFPAPSDSLRASDIATQNSS